MTQPPPKGRDDASRGLSPAAIAFALGGAAVVYWLVDWLRGVAP